MLQILLVLRSPWERLLPAGHFYITESCEEDDLENGEESLLHWSEVDLQGMMQYLNEPIPEPPHKQAKLNQVNVLLSWLCCFILSCKLLLL